MKYIKVAKKRFNRPIPAKTETKICECGAMIAKGADCTFCKSNDLSTDLNEIEGDNFSKVAEMEVYGDYKAYYKNLY